MAGQVGSGGRLVSRGFSQFAVAWFASFGITLVVVLTVAMRARVSLYDITDRVLMIGLISLALGWFVSVGWALVSRRAGTVAKLSYGVLAAVMLLPLLWAPVLAAVVAAWLSGASIEYSVVYAQFRIHVAQILFPLSTGLLHTDFVDALWNGFQVVATVIGFVASVISIWPLITQQLGRATSSEA
jgi:hypothetical protein